jgi:tetratricopeptide (TPR) repeat protein
MRVPGGGMLLASPRMIDLRIECTIMPSHRFLRLLPGALAVLAAASFNPARANDCGDLSNGFGPFDYRTASEGTKRMVEMHHFNRDVEYLRAGQNGYIGGDLSYTLRAFPNHPRALYAMLKLTRKTGTEKPEGSWYTMGCFFQRAVAFTPDDATVRVLYGLYLVEKNKKAEAKDELETARALVQKDELLQSDANVIYNLGLGFYEIGRYAEANEYARQAAALGFPLQGLQNMLKRTGKWQ